MLLEDEGYTVYAASNGHEALQILLDKTRPLPGLIALDFFMPVMDGRAFLQAFQKLKEGNSRFAGVNVIMVTAADANALSGIEEKTVGVLRKPIDIEAFLGIVGEWC